MLRASFVMISLVFSGLAFADPVNINTADADTLAASIVGVGPVISQRIVEYRDVHGAFADAYGIVRVRGVGEKIYEKNVADLLVE